MDKHHIRMMMKEKRLNMNQETFFLYNQSIFQQVMNHSIIQSSHMIACYVSMSGEVNTIQLIIELLKTKRVCVPRVEGSIMSFYEIHSLNDLKEGHFHVLEPITEIKIDSSEIDIMLVPMLAFDHRKYRVGYGKGYYDKYFSTGYHGYKLGLAFSFQQVDKIAIDQYDYCLDEIITEHENYINKGVIK